jgi:GDPmannose 4,6-dehydratase
MVLGARGDDMKSALVTGATGQDAHYLVDLLLERGYMVHAQSRSPQSSRDNSAFRWHVGDPANPEFLEDLILSTQPDEIYNLAAISRPLDSWAAPGRTATITALLPHAICELLLKHRPACRLFQASSSDMFGDCDSERQDERTNFQPESPYGAAKLYAHNIVGVYRRNHGLHGCCGIHFNHESPLRRLTFVSQKIAYAAAAASLGVQTTSKLDEFGRPILADGKLLLGDLSVRRDFGFAGDHVEAMYLILQHPAPDDYVVGTGENHSIEEFCDLAFRAVGLDWSAYVRVDPKLIRKTDSRYTRADPTKIQSLLSWRPKVGFQELVSTMVDAQLKSFQ